MSFVRLENLNDFIQPSSVCVKPQEKKSNGLVAKVSDISLSDCLACSGCITSAETVLVQQQNYDELFKIINANKVSKTNKTIVVSLSLQSIASLANRYDVPTQEAAERIASFFVSIGCDKVYDINLARHLALIESYREFKRRNSGKKENLPVINSTCPGWICYVEKTNGDLVIPHLSRVRSPQQIMGAILKRSTKRSDIYHVTLMPCFDKKLEASRLDFKNDDTQDVDCVLTPVELEMILADEGVTLMDLDPRKLDTLIETKLEFDQPLTSHFGSLSGGYAENVLIADACEHFGLAEDELRKHLEYSVVKNDDFIEVSLNFTKMDNNDANKTRRFAIVNGFRNIQTVVQRLKRRALKYDYIEIMACPSGCINGGAQCKPKPGHDQSSTIKESKSRYNDIKKIDTNVRSIELCDKLYKSLDLEQPDEVEKCLYTNFHSVPKMQNLTVNW